MAAIDWNEQLPSQNSAASLADNEFRSMVTNIAVGLGESFYWPGSAETQGASEASTGELRPGSARLLIVSASPTPGEGYLRSGADEDNIAHLGVSPSPVLSARKMLDRDGGIGNAPFTARWLLQFGVTSQTDDAHEQITFPTAYNGVPFVTISGADDDALSTRYAVREIDSSGFTIQREWAGSGATGQSRYQWMSEGTVSI